jgi:hypothetical protein
MSDPLVVARSDKDLLLLPQMAKSTTRAMGSQLGRTIIRGVLGSIFGGRC